MSYGGHVLDMIIRNRESREPLKRRREQARKNQKTYIGKGNLPQNLTAEKFEEINQAIKKRELQQQRYLSRMTFIIISGMIAVTILVCVIVKLLIF